MRNTWFPLLPAPYVCPAQDAIRKERYGEAAQVKAAISALEAQDAVASVQRQLKTALAEERYGDAADLRDSGLTGLQGWWAGQSEDDPVGHIMHITPEYSRSVIIRFFQTIQQVSAHINLSPASIST